MLKLEAPSELHEHGNAAERSRIHKIAKCDKSRIETELPPNDLRICLEYSKKRNRTLELLSAA